MSAKQAILEQVRGMPDDATYPYIMDAINAKFGFQDDDGQYFSHEDWQAAWAEEANRRIAGPRRRADQTDPWRRSDGPVARAVRMKTVGYFAEADEELTDALAYYAAMTRDWLPDFARAVAAILTDIANGLVTFARVSRGSCR